MPSEEGSNNNNTARRRPPVESNDIKLICDYISHKNGGEGCVRDVIEQTLKVTNNWNPNGKIKY